MSVDKERALLTEVATLRAELAREKAAREAADDAHGMAEDALRAAVIAFKAIEAERDAAVKRAEEAEVHCRATAQEADRLLRQAHEIAERAVAEVTVDLVAAVKRAEEAEALLGQAREWLDFMVKHPGDGAPLNLIARIDAALKEPR